MQTISVDRVTLHRNTIAAVFCELDRRAAGAVSGQAFETRAFEQADDFIRIACEHAAGFVPNVVPPVIARANPTELRLHEDQARALEVLERLAEGDRFIVEDERMGRALQHWVDQGFAGRDEDGHFLTPAGRTHAERTLG